MDILVLNNQVVMLQALLSLVKDKPEADKLKEQIIITKARIKALE